MGSLQLGLALLGALALAALAGHGLWQARRWSATRGAAAAPAAPIEPSFNPSDHHEGSAVSDETMPLTRRVAAAPPALDPLIDALAALRLEQRLAGEAAQAALRVTRRVGSKPMAIEGLDVRSGRWEPVHAGGTYSELQAGVQLANRSGPLNEIEYSEWVQKIQAFADAVGASAEFPDMLDVVARARELDAFAGAHDAQLAMRLHARATPWSVGFVQQQALRLGFVPGALPGRLVLPGDGEGTPPRLSLSFDRQAALSDAPAQAVVREVTLAFDVPQSAPELKVFDRWRDCGAALAKGLVAVVTDDQGLELDREALRFVGEELAELYGKLAERDVPAGSPVARRLFS